MDNVPLMPGSTEPGLIAVTGDEGSGKTRLLRRMAGDLPAQPGDVVCEAAHADACWLDLALPGQDDLTAQQVWAAVQHRSPRWDAELHHQLVEALALVPHQHKKLYMLSTGSRRKVALAGLLACGATLTCLDQPYSALDRPSIQVIQSFLRDMAEHPSRSCVVADYEADPQLPWRRVIKLTLP